jgi:transaldolase
VARDANLFAPAHERTGGVDGWVSLEVSPVLAYDANATVKGATVLRKEANRRNLFTAL